MTEGGKLLEFLTSCSLFGVECPACGRERHEGFLIIWSSGAEEQLDAYMAERQKAPSITIGSLTIGQPVDGKLWVQHESGEGMECSEEVLVDALKTFYAENF